MQLWQFIRRITRKLSEIPVRKRLRSGKDSKQEKERKEWRKRGGGVK